VSYILSSAKRKDTNRSRFIFNVSIKLNKMNETLKKTAKEMLKELLSECTEPQQVWLVPELNTKLNK